MEGRVDAWTLQGVAGVAICLVSGGLPHVSELAPHRVKCPAGEVSEGQSIRVKCFGVDGKIKLSRKALMAAEAPAEQL
jgi:predicted RNA-binding protein with RPS1 domain